MAALRLHAWGIFLSGVIVSFSSQDLCAANMTGNPCIDCHLETYESSVSSPYIHSVVQEDCQICHIKQESDEEEVTTHTYTLEQQENLICLNNADIQKQVISVSIPSAREDNILSIGPHIDQESIGTLQPENLNSITNVKVMEVAKGPYVRVTVTWDTDVLSTSGIEYKSDKGHTGRSINKGVYTRRHSITVRGLRHKSKYILRVISSDVSGKTLYSEPVGLDTGTELSLTRTDVYDRHGNQALDSIRALRIKDRKGVCIYVSVYEPVELRIAVQNADSKVDNKHGSGLTSGRYLMIKACYTCHEQNASHPVGISPRSDKVKIPDDLPTIEENVITCITCHYAHGGAEPYFSRVDFNQKLCIKCHVKGY